MEHIQGLLYVESNYIVVEHLQGLNMECFNIEIVQTERMEHIQGLLYIGSNIGGVVYMRV